MDVKSVSIPEFSPHAEWGSEMVWDRYNYSNVIAVIDKTGEFQRLVDDKGVVPE